MRMMSIQVHVVLCVGVRGSEGGAGEGGGFPERAVRI